MLTLYQYWAVRYKEFLILSSLYFVNRDQCPGCHCDKLTDVYQNPYNKDPLRNYLDNFYGSQGKVDFNYLEGADYHLSNCQDCGMIFQRQVPNDFLMEELYERWIDPKFVLQEHQRKDGLKKIY